MQTMFFATKEDLFPVLQRIEEKRTLKYVLTGLHFSPELTSFDSALDIPNLSIASSESAISGDGYLVVERTERVNMRPVPQNSGGIRYAVDQLENPGTIIFLPGGIFGENVLLYGRVATASSHPDSLALCRLFSASLKKSFSKIKSFYVGSAARKLLDQGCRLTLAVQTPREYDLSLSEE